MDFNELYKIRVFQTSYLLQFQSLTYNSVFGNICFNLQREKSFAWFYLNGTKSDGIL